MINIKLRMKRICILFLLMQLTLATDEGECDTKSCPSLPKHYEEMGCEAVKAEGNCCVRSFKCADLKTRDANKCYYKNEIYDVRETLKKSQLEGTCNGNCFCNEARDGKPAEFVCAHIDCPEFFHTHDAPRKCVRQYDREHCCAIKTICDEEMEKLATCQFEGDTYREGQKMYPRNDCYSCFCTKDFDNTTAVEENENCQKIDCGVTLRNTKRLFEGCIPVYYKRDNCCPIGWRCPGDKHNVVNANFTRRNEAEPICQYGSLQFNIGESLELDGGENCIECSCKVPPMLHCIEKC